MALTHALKRQGNPVRDFFERRFPAERFKALSTEWYKELRAQPLVCAPPEGVNAGTIGTAFDYRARLCWAPLDWSSTVAAGGAMHTVGIGAADLDLLAIDLRDQLALVAAERCAGDLDDLAEERVCRCCYALALYEQFFRTTVARVSSPLLDLDFAANIEDVLALAPTQAIDDLASMARLLCSSHPQFIDARAILNPTFEGSIDIGGADADLIIDRMLVELKTTRKESFERVEYLYQLIGYTLLDYSDTYSISDVAVYLARRGVLLHWELGELLATCCDTDDLPTLRRDFRDAVARLVAP